MKLEGRRQLTFDHGLKPLDVLSNQELMKVFRCGISGGMRRSNYANALIIISDHTKSIYDDRWIGEIFHYTGMGLVGDQKLDYSQNKTLYKSNELNISLYLFEVFKRGEYIYQGEVILAGEPYQEEQPDINGNLRKVWIFPLKLKENQAKPILPTTFIEETQEIKEKQVQKLSDGELINRLKYVPKVSGYRNATTKIYERNIYVAEFVKRIANGICQLCEQPAPFKDKNGQPYLEVHHIIWLSKGGEDTVENTIALCPNCHKKMHILDLKEDVEKLKERALKNKFYLEKVQANASAR